MDYDEVTMISTAEIKPERAPVKRFQMRASVMVSLRILRDSPEIKDYIVEKLRLQRDYKSREMLLGIDPSEWKDEFWMGPLGETRQFMENRPAIKLDW